MSIVYSTTDNVTLNYNTLVKMQQCIVLQPGGAFICTLPDAPLLSGFKEAINSATGQLVFTLPRRFDNFDEAGSGGPFGAIAQGNIIQFWLFGSNLPGSGELRYQGLIDKYSPKIESDGKETIEITLTPYGSQIGDVGVNGTFQMGSATATTSSTAVSPGSATIVIGSATGLVQGAYISIDTGVNLEYVTITTLSGTNLTATFTKSHSGTYNVGGPMDPAAMFTAWFNLPGPAGLSTWTTPLTLDGSSLTTSSASQTWYVWQNQTLLSIWQTILVMLATDTPNWFFRITPQGTVILSKTPTTAQNIFYFPQHLASMSYTKDWTLLKNNILRVGSSPSVNASAVGTDIATFGLRSDFASDPRLTTAAQCQVLANGTLALEDRVRYRATITVLDYRGDANYSFGYDIETLRVGQSVQLINMTEPPIVGGPSNWDAALWDVALWDAAGFSTQTAIVQIVGLSYQYDCVVLELANLAPAVTVDLAQLAVTVQDFTIIPGV